MQLVNRPIAAPGQCKGCGAADRGPYVDTGWSEEFYGALYYCRDCTLEMASLYGAISPEAADAIKLELAAAREHAFKLEVELRKITDVKEALHAYFNSGITSWSSSGDGSVVSSDPLVEAAEPTVAEPAVSIVESSDGERPADTSTVGNLDSAKGLSLQSI